MQRARRKDPQTLDAWELAIRAQWHLARITREDNAEALRLATESTRLNPGTTAGLNIAAFAHIYEAVYGWSASPGQSFLAAHEAARQAVTMDTRDEVAQTALAPRRSSWGSTTAPSPGSVMPWSSTRTSRGPTAIWAWRWPSPAKATRRSGQFKEAVRLSPRDQFCFLWLYLLGFGDFMAGRYGTRWSTSSNRCA